jgi:hypothetical protein
MSELQLPDQWNGKPTKYKFFDGFTQAGLLGKIAYVIGFPAISIIMEGYRYNVETRNGEAAAAAINQEIYASHMNEALNPGAPEDGRFAAMLAQQSSPHHSR